MKNKKPIIGISASLSSKTQFHTCLRDHTGTSTLSNQTDYYYARPTYTERILAAGGIPLILPFNHDPEVFTFLDGILIPGGDDIHPAYFNQDELFKGDYETQEKIEFDQWIIGLCMEFRMPLFGICYGMQIINVSLGGDLCQDVSLVSEWADHPYNKKGLADHEIHIQNPSILASVFASPSIHVNSKHHQAIQNLGTPLIPTAYAPDGIVEAVELDGESSKNHFLIAVQWHPELIENQTPLWEAFIQAAASYR